MPREESFIISKIYIIERNSTEEKYTMRVKDWRKAKKSEAKPKNDIAGKGRNSVLYYNFAHEFVPMEDLKKALHLIPFEGESKNTLSLLAAQRICETKFFKQPLKIRGVRDTLKCEPGKKGIRTPSVVLISELRIESYEKFRRLWRSVSQRRMPRETEKYE